MSGVCGGGIGEMKMRTKFWLESLKLKRPLGRPKDRREENIKMDLEEIGWSGLNSSGSG
jgi:hypothetical protein